MPVFKHKPGYPESKKAFKERAQSGYWWDKAVRDRESKFKELLSETPEPARSDKTVQRQLKDQAWIWVMNEYRVGGPLCTALEKGAAGFEAEVKRGKFDIDAIKAQRDELPESVDQLTEIRWIKGNMGSDDVMPCNAPSRAAWDWLQHCRDSEKAKNDFYSVHVSKLTPKPEADTDPRFCDDGGAVVDLGSRVLQECLEAARGEPKATN